MKRIAFLTIALGWVSGPALPQDDIRSRDFVKSLADKVNHYQYNNPNPSSNNNWIRGTYYTGMMALYQASRDERYLNQCVRWGEETGWQIPVRETNVYGSGFYSLVCGQIWMECYMDQKRDYMIQPTIDHLSPAACRRPLTCLGCLLAHNP